MQGQPTVLSRSFSRRLPLALARLHARLALGATVEIRVAGRASGQAVPDVVVGAGFVDVEVVGTRPSSVFRARRGRTLPDFVGPRMRALVCGLNPSLVAADAGFGFAGATNRFWSAALQAGLISVARQPLVSLHRDRVGMTDLVKRATARSHHLDRAEYVAGAERVRRLVRWLAPDVVVFVGLQGWRAAVARDGGVGWQPGGFGGVPAYVLPSTSGANAHVQLPDLVAHFGAALGGPP